jgi:hypothetical protein
MFNSKLLAVAAALAVGAPVAAGAPDAGPGWGEKIVCQKVVATGSVVARSIICRPESHWGLSMDQVGKKLQYREEILPAVKGKGGQTLQTGQAKWDRLPVVRAKPGHLPYRELVSRVEEMLRRKQCELPGQSARSFDIEVPYAVYVEQGQVKRVLVSDVKCPAIQELVGVTVLARAERGDFEPTKEAAGRWFGDRINFTLR